jgi:hypothetical protein
MGLTRTVPASPAITARRDAAVAVFKKQIADAPATRMALRGFSSGGPNSGDEMVLAFLRAEIKSPVYRDNREAVLNQIGANRSALIDKKHCPWPHQRLRP